MATPAHNTVMTPAAAGAGGGGPAEPVPVAFLGRTSTLEMQDPVASLRRQIRSSQAWLPPGLVHRRLLLGRRIRRPGPGGPLPGRGLAGRSPTPGSPATAAWPTCSPKPPAPAPKFAAVICEDIERSGRDTFNALKLEKKLSRNGIPLFATDEPAVIDGVNATTVLVRRMKQGVAEWFRLQLKEKTWKGLVEHALDGWNIGPAPYGYLADRIPHPVPVKASQGRTKTRLALDPDRAPVVAQIFTWRIVDKLGMPTIAARLNADPARYPAPGRERLDHPDRVRRCWATPSTPGTWSTAGSASATAAASPSRQTSGCGHPSPSTRRSWTGPPGTPPRHIGAEHGTSRDGDGLSTPPGRDPDLRLPGPDPVPGLPPPDGRPGLRPAAPPERVLPVPAQPGQPPARRRQPRPPPHRQGPRDPPGPDRRPVLHRARLRPRPRRAARRPAPRHRRRRGRRPRRPGRRPQRPAQADRHRRRTPASSNWNNSPPTRPTPPPPRCAPGSAPGSPSSTPTASKLETQLDRPGRRPPPRPPTRPCSTSCRWPGTSCPACPRT